MRLILFQPLEINLTLPSSRIYKLKHSISKTILILIFLWPWIFTLKHPILNSYLNGPFLSSSLQLFCVFSSVPFSICFILYQAVRDVICRYIWSFASFRLCRNKSFDSWKFIPSFLLLFLLPLCSCGNIPHKYYHRGTFMLSHQLILVDSSTLKH